MSRAAMRTGRRDSLTPPENTAIIAALFAVDAKEQQRLARRIVWLQMAVTLVTAGIAYRLNGAPQYAAVLCGGLASVLNGTLLAWRMSSAALHHAQGSYSSDAHHQLRLMYFYAAERFLVVVLLLGLCMAVLKLPPLAVLVGFVLGQATLLAARLFSNGLNKS